MKKLMSKLVAFALVATLAFALTGCFVTPNTAITFNKYPYGTYAVGTDVETALAAIEVTLTENGEVVKTGSVLALRDEGLVVVEGFNLADKGNNKTAKIVFGTTVVTFTYSVVGSISEDGSLSLGETSVNENIYSEYGVYTSEAGDYNLELNGHTISVADYVGSWVEGGNLTISNGVIDTRESSRTIGVLAEDGGVVTLTDVQLLTAGASNPLQAYAGTLILNNVTAVQSGLAAVPWYDSAIQIANRIKKDEAGTWYYTGVQAYLTVNGGMYSGARALQMSAPGGVVVINEGTFVGSEYVIKADYSATYASQGAVYSITINGGTFTGVVSIAKNIECVVNGGTFSVNIAEVANVTIGEGKTVVDNEDGTWTVVPATPAE